MNNLLYTSVKDFTTESGYFYPEFELSYQLFGQELNIAPIILVNHALTGNSNVAGKNGWWNDLIGPGKVIDTNNYTIITINIPGNGYDEKPENLIDNYEDFNARDIARLFGLVLKKLNINRLFAAIGGSLGGGIAWEMAFLFPDMIENLVPVATDWKASDWILAHNKTQLQILSNSSQPVHDARMMAMLFYRTADSFKQKFNRTKNKEQGNFNTESWLLYHGKQLENRFTIQAYKMLNHLLSTIDVSRDRGTLPEIANQIKANVHQVGVDSDFFFVPQEIKETQKILDKAGVFNTYNEIKSIHGHDAFLIEYDQLSEILNDVFKAPKVKFTKAKKLKIVKFGGKSLANGEGVEKVVQLISNKIKNGEKIAVVASARGNSTDALLEILEDAQNGNGYKEKFQKFKEYQLAPDNSVDFSREFDLLQKVFEGVHLLGDYSTKIKDRVLAQGELMSVKMLANLLRKDGFEADYADSRKLIKTDDTFGEAVPIQDISRENVIKHFKNKGDQIQIITGFIASNLDGETTTLGRNGSNYSASLLANYLDAEELENYTHVDGIFTANPDLVSDAKKIEELTFQEANELANFGANILHAKTIIPLVEKNIPLRLLNTFDSDNKGTLIKSQSKNKGIRSVTVQENVSLISMIGRGLLGKSGVDARIFSALAKDDISVSIISQGSSERGIGFVVNSTDAKKAKLALEKEFSKEFETNDVNDVHIQKDLGIISIIGQSLDNFHSAYSALMKNRISPVLINNTVTGDNISLLLENKDLHKSVNVIHGHIFGVSIKINIAVFGKGLVAGTMINQILKSANDIEKRKNIKLNIFAVADSKKVLLQKEGIDQNWEKDLIESGVENYNINDVIQFAKKNHLENLIAVDNTADEVFIQNYIPLVESGFDLVSSNKIANTESIEYYNRLRSALRKNEKSYLYETNVGAGLPLVDTIKLLHHSGENITKIRGVFSGSLSYLFNNFSIENKPFGEILNDAIQQGFTEPDPREDLSGNDVGRKLLILARELDLQNEFEDIKIQNLIPEHLRDGSKEEFLSNNEDLNRVYQEIKEKQKAGNVLRYVGELSGDLHKEKGDIEVKLVSVPDDSSLGQVKGSDSIFEIYTESYGDRPIIIQGAGAGAKVTARGVFGDILRLAEKAF
ncbi:MAG: bifunctional aspartate kinase/homoserine dehydrogenase I [Bacteroidota bacterium]